MKSIKEIYTYMNGQVDDHIDLMTGELDLTALVEDAADEFDLGEDIPEIYFEMAVELEAKLLGNSFQKGW